MTILVTGANGQLGNEMRIVSKNSEDRYIFTDVVDASEESIAMLKKLAGEDIKTDTQHLDITEIAVRTCRNYAEGDDRPVVRGVLQGVQKGVEVDFPVTDDMVRRNRYHHGLRVPFQQGVCRVGEAGGRVAAVRLQEEVFREQLREVLHHLLLVVDVRHDEDVFHRDDLRDPLEGEAQETLSGS